MQYHDEMSWLERQKEPKPPCCRSRKVGIWRTQVVFWPVMLWSLSASLCLRLLSPVLNYWGLLVTASPKTPPKPSPILPGEEFKSVERTDDDEGLAW